MRKFRKRFFSALLIFAILITPISGMTALASGTSDDAAVVTETESVPESQAQAAEENQSEDSDGDSEAAESLKAAESSGTDESSEALESPAVDESSEAAESSAVDESSEAAESSAVDESSEAVESSAVDESSEAVESSAADESSEAMESLDSDKSSEAMESSGADESSEAAESSEAEEYPQEELELSEAAISYIRSMSGITESISQDSYESIMARLLTANDAYAVISDEEKTHPDVVAANAVWSYLVQVTQAASPASITDTSWNLLTNDGYPDPYEQGGIYIHSLANVGSGFVSASVESADQTGWYRGSNRSKDTSVYMDWTDGAYMGEAYYDVRVYYWCPDGDYYVSRSANMTAATTDLSEKRIFMEFHFFPSGKAGQWAYEVQDFYGVMGSRDLDYVQAGHYYEGWAFPVNQNDNNSSVIGNVYTSSDTTMEIQWDKFSISNNTHKNGTPSSTTYYFLPYFATQKESAYGWDDYACIFWTFHAMKSDPMVLCYYTAGPLQAGLNGDPTVVRYYLTSDSALPAGANTVIPNSVFTTYGAKFQRFESATVYKGYNFTGWSINKNLSMTTEFIQSGTAAWVKESGSAIYYLTSAGDYRLGTHNSASAYTLYGAGANWYGMKLADGLTNGTYEWDQDCGVTYQVNGSSVSVGLSPNNSNYGTIRRILLFGKYVPWTGTVQIIKTSSTDSSVKVSGAVYGLYSNSACTNLLASATTNSSGVASFNYSITYGTTYYVKEISCPSGYTLNTTVYTVGATALESDKGTVTVSAADAPAGYIELYKTGQSTGKPVKSIEYTVYSNMACTKAVCVLTTDANGYAISDPLDAGTYYVKETKAKPGFAVNSTIIRVSLAAGQTHTILSELTSDREWFGTVRLNKTDSVTGQNISDYGGVMSVYEWSANSNSYVFLENMTVVSGTYYVIVHYSDNNLGKFKIVETTNPTGYTGTYEQEFALDLSAGTAGEMQEYTFNFTANNTPRHISFVINKTDAVDGEVLQNTRFALEEWSDAAGEYVYLKDVPFVEANNRYESGTLYYTPDNLGKYRVYEAESQDGYILDNWSREINVLNYGNGTTITYTVKNTPTRYRFIKKDAGGAALAGCEFELYNADGDLIDSWLTDNTGIHELTAALIEGETYTLKEVDCPIGYALAEDLIFTVNADKDWIEIETANQMIPSSVTIYKRGADGGLLDGARYALATTEAISGAETYWYNGLTYFICASADTINGMVTFEGLDTVHGYRYLLIEIQSPDGTALLAEPIDLGILPVVAGDSINPGYAGKTQTKDGVIYLYDLSYTITNTANFILPQTGVTNLTPIITSIAITMAALPAHRMLNIKSKKEDNSDEEI